MVEGHTRGGLPVVLCSVGRRQAAGYLQFLAGVWGVLGGCWGDWGGTGGGFFQGDLRWEECGRWAWKGGGEVRGG